MVLILCLALTICVAALCSGKALERKLKSGGLWWCWGFACAFALLPIAAGPVDGRYGPLGSQAFWLLSRCQHLPSSASVAGSTWQACQRFLPCRVHCCYWQRLQW